LEDTSCGLRFWSTPALGPAVATLVRQRVTQHADQATQSGIRMKRDNARIAANTLALIEKGAYEAAGVRHDLTAPVAAAADATRFYDLEDIAALPRPARANAAGVIEVVAQSTLQAMQDMTGQGMWLAALNFASARNPGGGFLGGAQAQEESLARSGGLYPCLLRAVPFYDAHRRERDLCYSHRMVFSPRVPFFKNDAGDLLAAPYVADIVTAAAPNFGAVEANQAADLHRVPHVLRERADRVLALAAHHGHTHLVLGAWGCGVFRNPPGMVAGAFAALLGAGGPYHRAFELVRFAIYDRSRSQTVAAAFLEAFG
jgi:uncharacterized protein (TIGR02452 family)